jgi:hypothetical protein
VKVKVKLKSAVAITEELTYIYPDTPGSKPGKQIYFKACTFSSLPAEPSGKGEMVLQQSSGLRRRK